jgi:hypothetical protein
MLIIVIKEKSHQLLSLLLVVTVPGYSFTIWDEAHIDHISNERKEDKLVKY